MILKDLIKRFIKTDFVKCAMFDKRCKSSVWIDDQRRKRDGIYGQPYDFPFQAHHLPMQDG